MEEGIILFVMLSFVCSFWSGKIASENNLPLSVGLLLGLLLNLGGVIIISIMSSFRRRTHGGFE